MKCRAAYVSVQCLAYKLRPHAAAADFGADFNFRAEVYTAIGCGECVELTLSLRNVNRTKHLAPGRFCVCVSN